MIVFDEEELIISRGEWLPWSVVEMYYNDLIKEIKWELDYYEEDMPDDFGDTLDVIENIIKYELTYADKKEIMSYIKDEAEIRDMACDHCTPLDFGDDEAIKTIIAQWIKDHFETEIDFETFV